jgi:hypothetical protein
MTVGPGRTRKNEKRPAIPAILLLETAMNDTETPAIHTAAQQLIVSGHLPAPFNVDPHDQRPLWDFVGLAELLNQRPDQLVQLLQANGPAYLPGAGIPSSWRMLIEL